MHKLTGGLYSPEFEKDACGFGMIAHMDDKPSPWLLDTAIGALERSAGRPPSGPPSDQEPAAPYCLYR